MQGPGKANMKELQKGGVERSHHIYKSVWTLQRVEFEMQRVE